MGPIEFNILRSCRDNIPKRIREAPDVRRDLEIYYFAFFTLSTCRQLGMGEGPISWTAINDYCNQHGITGEIREDLEHHIRAMDSDYLKFRARQDKARQKQ